MAAAALLSRRLHPRLKLHRSLCQITQRMDCGPFPLPVQVQDDIDKGAPADESAPASETVHFSPRPNFRFSPYVYFVKRIDATDNAMFLRLATTSTLHFTTGYDCIINQICLLPPFSQPAAARHCLAQMLLRGQPLCLVTFSLLIQAYCKDLQLSYLHVLDLFTGMKALGFKPDDSSYKHYFYKDVMDAMFARFGFIFGYRLLKSLTSTLSIMMPLWCYDVLVGRFCRGKMVEDAKMVSVLIDILIEMKNHQVIPDEKIYKYLLKRRPHGGDDLLKAGSIGKQMFVEGIKIGAISPVLLPRLMRKVAWKNKYKTKLVM